LITKNWTYSQLDSKTFIVTFSPLKTSFEIKKMDALKKCLEKEFGKDAVNEVLLTISTLTLFFNTAILMEKVVQQLKSIIQKFFFEKDQYFSTQWKMPVCFHKDFSQDIYQHFKEDTNQVIKYQHQLLKQSYLLNFFGFLPGFFYLSGLPSAMQIARKLKPALIVKKGTLAVGGNFIGIYPQQSPGGWWGVGNVPICIFDINQSPPCFGSPGDFFSFYEISIEKHKELMEKQEKGEKIVIEKTLYNEL